MKISNGIKIMACSILIGACSNSPKQTKVMREFYPNGTFGRILKDATVKSKIGLDSSYKIRNTDTINVGRLNKITVDNLLEKIEAPTNGKCVNERGDKNFKGVITSPKAYKNEDGDIYIPIEIYNKIK